MNTLGKIGFFICGILCFGGVGAQSVHEIGLLGTQELPGSAYSKSMGGAQSALGSVSSTCMNPAVGVDMKRSEFIFSPQYVIRKSTQEFLGSQTLQTTSNANLGTMGMLLHSNSFGGVSNDSEAEISEADAKTENPRAFALGIVFNRTNDFNREQGYDVFNTKNSITEYYGELSAQSGLVNTVINFDSLYKLEELAFITYLTNTDPDSSNGIYSRGIAEGGNIGQSYLRHSDGSVNNLDFSVASRRSSKLLLGAAGSMMIFRYKYNTSIKEIDSLDNHLYFEELTFEEEYKASGIGFGFKVGTVYKPAPWINVGLSYHLSTRISVSRRYFASIDAKFNNHPELIPDTSTSPDNYSNEYARTMVMEAGYNMKTPGRAILGIALQNKNIGTLTSDLELIHQSGKAYKDRFTTDPGLNYATVNDAVADAIGVNMNLRLGGELKFQDNRIRLGFARYNLIKNEYTPSYTYVTAGYGIYSANHFMNFTYIKRFGNEVFTSYPVKGVQDEGPNKMVGTDIVISYGIRF